MPVCCCYCGQWPCPEPVVAAVKPLWGEPGGRFVCAEHVDAILASGATVLPLEPGTPEEHA